MPRLRSLATAAMLLVMADGSDQAYCVDAPALAAPMQMTAAAGPLLPEALWGAYRNHFIFPEGRLWDDGNDGVSHTEGQGYAMLLAVFADDRATFARVWAWTSRELFIRPDGLGAWRWEAGDSPHVKDRNNATDGDLLIAWALAEAAERWEVPGYRAAARKLALAIGRSATQPTGLGRVLMPGVVGFSAGEMPDGPIVNLSYWVFPAFDALAKVAPEVEWEALRDNGLRLIKASRFGPAGLPSDWISLRGRQPEPAEKFPKTFGYNAIRIPLYLAWVSAADRDALAPFVEHWKTLGNGQPSVIDVVSGRAVEPFYDTGYQAVVSLAACAVDGARFPDELKTVRLGSYYSTTIQMLSLIALRQRYAQCW
ncbi:MAG: cellulase [Methylobacteriaceae bacterium]|nr:cellulase [Methylobacteriaceae bacterium]